MQGAGAGGAITKEHDGDGEGTRCHDGDGDGGRRLEKTTARAVSLL